MPDYSRIKNILNIPAKSDNTSVAPPPEKYNFGYQKTFEEIGKDYIANPGDAKFTGAMMSLIAKHAPGKNARQIYYHSRQPTLFWFTKPRYRYFGGLEENYHTIVKGPEASPSIVDNILMRDSPYRDVFQKSLSLVPNIVPEAQFKNAYGYRYNSGIRMGDKEIPQAMLRDIIYKKHEWLYNNPSKTELDLLSLPDNELKDYIDRNHNLKDLNLSPNQIRSLFDIVQHTIEPQAEHRRLWG